MSISAVHAQTTSIHSAGLVDPPAPIFEPGLDAVVDAANNLRLSADDIATAPSDLTKRRLVTGTDLSDEDL